MRSTFIIAAACALFSLASCSNNGAGNAPATDSSATNTVSKEERNKKIIMDCMAGINAHDVNKVFSDTSNHDMVEYFDGSMPPAKGDSAKMALAGFLKSFPDLKFENAMYFADGNHVVVISDYTLTFSVDMAEPPIKATGKTAKFKDADIFELSDDGKILSHRNIYPNSALFAALGVDMSKMAPPPAKDTKK